MTSAINFSNLSSISNLFYELNKASNLPNYKWLREITSRTCDRYVYDAINDQLALDKYAPWRIEENIYEAGVILNNCIDRKSEILNLEAEAIQCALGISLAEQVQEQELLISQAMTCAARQQAGISQPSADDDPVNIRDATITDARRSRLMLHDKSGTALNYGERVLFLRKLLSDEIRKAYERMYAIWIGLSASFQITKEPPPKWLPESQSLEKLVFWLRDAAEQIELTKRHEGIHDLYLALEADSITPAGYVSSELQSTNHATIKFKLKREHFPNLEQDDRVRLIGIGATVSFGNLYSRWLECLNGSQGDREVFSFAYQHIAAWRQAMSLMIDVTLPVQSVSDPFPYEVSESVKKWQLQKIALRGMGAWSELSPENTVRIKSSPHFMNSNPLGDWEIQVMNGVRYPSINRNISVAGSAIDLHDDGIEKSLKHYLRPKDVLIALRIVTWKAGVV